MQHGYSKVSIRTVDTDVVVLAIASVNRLKVAELWIAFGAGKSFRFIVAHEITEVLGPESCVALSMFHAFTGCDVTLCPILSVEARRQHETRGPPMQMLPGRANPKRQ